MTTEGKQLSAPFATGSGGGRFESHIQANFVTLMLSGGYAPMPASLANSRNKPSGQN